MSLATEADELAERAVTRVGSAETLDELRAVEVEVLGKQSPLAAVRQKLKDVPPEDRRDAGQSLNQAWQRVEQAIADRRQSLEVVARDAQLQADRLDLTEVTGGPRRGSLNLVTQATYRLEDTFVGMGFTVAEGPEVETDWHNFEALNIPKAHPARASQDSLYLDFGEPESTLLRTQTSPVQIRVMMTQAPPIYSIMPGRVYRKDTPDARHTPSFSQIEGLVVDRGITFGDLAGTIETFTGAFFGPGTHSRLRPAYFPFTEPSAEFEITCVICGGTGCRTCSGTGWIELGGCGMVHPAVFESVGIDPEEWSGFAFGFGIDRQAQMRHAIADMRILFDNDIRFINQF
ncbi:MAG: phenylalanyl-tRNA synthetase alpha chain [Actinomycetota bacterium]|nr:phenylalanyl-tRNA synthetase alpha chain [Actinomycetota bacterium]